MKQSIKEDFVHLRQSIQRQRTEALKRFHTQLEEDPPIRERINIWKIAMSGYLKGIRTRLKKD